MKNKGKTGEDIIARFLMKHGFSIFCRNFRVRAGELDIVATKGNFLYFFEVKTVSCDTINRPEENVHYKKRRKLAKTIELFHMKHKSLSCFEWKFFVGNVVISRNEREYTVYFVSDTLS